MPGSPNLGTLPGADVLEGDFLASLQAGAKLETASRSYVDLTLRVVEGAAEGALFADRIVAVEREDEAELHVSDEAIQKLTDAEHQRTLRDKEWRAPQSPRQK